jgi:hypothetical protein
MSRVAALDAPPPAPAPFLAGASLSRWSRMAAWAAIPAAVAGCLLATHFLEQLAVHYGAG